MAVQPKLGDAEIASLMVIPHPSIGGGESSVVPCHPLDMQDAMIEQARRGAIVDATWMS